LFQIVFHARLGDEDGFFDMAGVARTVHDKLVHRHPHVFGDVEADDAGQVMANWEEIKRSEKGRASVTEGIPAALPALVYASKLARKARSVGVEPHDQDASEAAADLSALARLAEESSPHPDDPLRRDERVERQIGDLLFAIVNLAQRVGVDAEQALRERALVLRDDIRRAEGVPDGLEDNR
jgi:uncharacterized protein YabN with tetrapyrrole methylase and pyrophosphatase domain